MKEIKEIVSSLWEDLSIDHPRFDRFRTFGRIISIKLSVLNFWHVYRVEYENFFVYEAFTSHSPRFYFPSRKSLYDFVSSYSIKHSFDFFCKIFKPLNSLDRCVSISSSHSKIWSI